MSNHEQIEVQAARWLMRRQEPDWSSAQREELERWLEESFAHKAAYWRLEHGWELADTGDGDAVPSRARWTHIPQRRPGMLALAASLVIAILAGGIWMAGQWPRPVETVQYATQHGQRGTLQLSDGTKVELNTDTSVRIAQTEERRTVWIDDGEAFFEVARDPEHPFVVHAGARDIIVLGTKFNVYRVKGRVTVSVLEGRVRIADPAAGDENANGAVITRGDMAIADGSSTLITSGALDRIERQLQWRNGIINFDNTPLYQAVEAFNRYNRQKLVVRDPALAQIRIGGSFRADNAKNFAELLRQAYGIETEISGDKIILLEN